MVHVVLVGQRTLRHTLGHLMISIVVVAIGLVVHVAFKGDKHS